MQNSYNAIHLPKERNNYSKSTLYIAMIHIGSIIKKRFDEQGLSASWFAKQLCCDRTNIYSIFKRESIDTMLLSKISTILKHDFFIYYSEDIKEQIYYKQYTKTDCQYFGIAACSEKNGNLCPFFSFFIK